MKIVLEITPHNHENNIFYKILEWDSIKVGRGYSNNVIINDPYLEAEHLEIFRDGNDVFVEDLNSSNGVRVNGKKRDISKVHMGDTVTIGSSKIRFLSPSTEVPPAVKIIDKRFFLSWIDKASSAWISIILMVLLAKFHTYMELWPRKEHDMLDLIVIASTAGVVIIWSLLWSVASRLIRYRANFKSHITIASLYMICSFIAMYLQAYVMFLSNDNVASDIFYYTINFVLLGGLIYGSLTYTNNIKRLKNRVFAVLFAAGIICGMISVDYISSLKFRLRPRYSSSMEAYMSSLIRTQTLEDFMVDNKKLFSSKVLDKIQK